MTLYECALGTRCRIISCDTQDSALMDRFLSFGIVKGRVCKVICHSFKRLGIAVLLNGMQIALRDTEAKMIVVEVVWKD